MSYSLDWPEVKPPRTDQKTVQSAAAVSLTRNGSVYPREIAIRKKRN